MSKMLKLLEWVTVPQAAKHLAAIVGEEVSEVDVLRLALDGRIALSVDLVNHAEAIRGKVIPLSEAKILPGIPVEGVEPYSVVAGLVLPDGDRVLSICGERVVSISGVWDLPMFGAERLDVEHRYQQLTSGPEVTLVCFDGPYVQRGDDVWELQTPFDDKKHVATGRLSERWSPSNFYPAGRLPNDAVFVVRTAELARFQAELAEADQKQHRAAAPLEPRSETTYLNIIGALLELVRTPRPGRGSDAAVIRELIENYSDKPGIAKSTLEGKFAEARRQLRST